MPTYRIKIGDSTYRVDSPQELTDEQAYAAVAPQHEQFTQKVQAEEERVRENFRQEEKARPLPERIWTNVLAGAHKLGQAVTFAPKAEVEEHNKYRAGAAETVPGGEYIQMAGEVAPSMLVPGGAGGRALSMLPRVGQAIGRGIGTRAGSVANVAGTQGALGALTTAGDLSDRAIGGGLAAGAGAALPGALSAVQGGWRMATTRGGQRAAGERFLRELEQEAPGRADELVGALRDPVARARQSLGGVERPTAAQLTNDPVLRELEVGARTRQGASFAPGDEAANQGRANVLSEIAGTPRDLAAAELARKTATDPMRAAALQGAAASQGFERPVMQTVLAVASGEGRPNPAVQTMANYVIGELQRGVTPAQLYTIRKTLTTGVPHGSELGSAITQARAERMKIVESIDDALDAATGGQWRAYMQRYQQLSQPVTSLKAGQAIERDFGGSARTTFEGDPVLTAGRLRKAVQSRGEKQFGGTTRQRLTPEERSRLEAVADTAEGATAARMSQGIEGSRTAGNISAGNRVGDLAASGVGALVGGVPGAVIGRVLPKWHADRAERILARLLQDPEELARVIELAQGARRTTQSVAELGRAGQLGTGFAE